MSARFLPPVLALALGLALAAPGGGAGAPELIVEAPPRYEGLARQLRDLDPSRLRSVAELIGSARPGPPIRVLLAPEGSTLAAVPPWVSGYADSASGTVVLLPARTPTYPDSSLTELLRHEVAHVLVARAAGGRPLPRWFHEGVAMIAGGSWSLDDRSTLTLALLREREIPLAELERRFGEGRGAVEGAYAVAGAFVRELVRRHGPGVIGRVLSGVAAGLSFEDAFERAAGEPLAAAEASFWRRQTFWYRWMPLLTSSFTLWLAITLLVLVAARRRRARTAELRRRWEEEEQAAPSGEGEL